MEISIHIIPGPHLPQAVLEKLAERAASEGVTTEELISKVLVAAAAETEPQPVSV
jgi:hypothetical protein